MAVRRSVVGWTVTASVVLVGVVLAVALSAGSSPTASVSRRTTTSSPAAASTTTTVGATSTTATTVAASTSTTVTTTVTTSTIVSRPGSTVTTEPANVLVPGYTDAALDARLAPLWSAISSGDVARAASLVEPKSVYVTMTTGRVADPASSYRTLVALFDADLAAYHRSLGEHATATLVGFETNVQDLAFVPSVTCQNNDTYWHLAGVRLVYAIGRQVRSVGIASLMSWQGTWYVESLGPTGRTTVTGALDDPAVGAGKPGPPGGC